MNIKMIHIATLCVFATSLYSMDQPISTNAQRLIELFNGEEVKNEKYPSLSSLKKLARAKEIIATDEEIESAWTLTYYQVPTALPSRYLHRNIQDQIKSYRDIYTKAFHLYEKDAQSIKTKPIPGLFNLLRNVFALSNDYIQRDTKRTVEEKELSLRHLSKLWERSLPQESTLNSRKFQEVIIDLAKLVQKVDPK